MTSIVDNLKRGAAMTPTDPSRMIEVIGSGLGRTGTISMSAALEKLLNGPCYHTGTRIMQDDQSTIQTWLRMFRKKEDPEFIRSSLQSLLGGYIAVTDTFGAAFTPELLDIYPHAIVICTIRDPEGWFKSLSAVMSSQLPLLVWRLMFWPLPVFRYLPDTIDGVWNRLCEHYHKTPLGSRVVKFIQDHIDWLNRVVPPERLHFFNVKDGWEPLCQILKVPIPDEPFPRANEQAAMEELEEVVKGMMLKRWGMIIGGTLVAIGGAMLSTSFFFSPTNSALAG